MKVLRHTHVLVALRFEDSTQRDRFIEALNGQQTVLVRDISPEKRG